MAVGKQRPQIEWSDIAPYLATKEDVANVRTDVEKVRTELVGVRVEIGSVRTELKTEISGMRLEISNLETRLVKQYNFNSIITTLIMIAGFGLHYLAMKR